MSQQNNSSYAPPHGGSYQPGESRAAAEQELYYAQSNSPPPHGGSYQPGGSRTAASQEQHYAQTNSPEAHGGNYQPGQQGQQGRQNVPQSQAPGSTQGQMAAAPRGAYPEQTSWQQQQQQPNYIAGPIQPHLGYNPANQVRLPYLYITFAETI
jgi:hypothetical protein